MSDDRFRRRGPGGPGGPGGPNGPGGRRKFIARRKVCGYCTGFVRYILDQVQQRPARLGLPDHTASSDGTPVNGQLLMAT